VATVNSYCFVWCMLNSVLCVLNSALIIGVCLIFLGNL
jgi:uncharacterized membrane protein